MSSQGKGTRSSARIARSQAPPTSPEAPPPASTSRRSLPPFTESIAPRFSRQILLERYHAAYDRGTGLLPNYLSINSIDSLAEHVGEYEVVLDEMEIVVGEMERHPLGLDWGFARPTPISWTTTIREGFRTRATVHLCNRIEGIAGRLHHVKNGTARFDGHLAVEDTGVSMGGAPADDGDTARILQTPPVCARSLLYVYPANSSIVVREVPNSQAPYRL